MKNKILIKQVVIVLILLQVLGCKIFKEPVKTENRSVPVGYKGSQDTINTARVKWRNYFNDPNLVALIDTALKNNQELNITRQEIEIARNEVKAKKGEYLPFAGIIGGAGVDKSGKYTWNGLSEEDWKENHSSPKYIGDFMIAATSSWELDVWKKLRNSRNAAAQRYLSSIEGKNFMVTGLVAEIASSYYELMALDNLLEIIRQNIEIQHNACKIVKQEKEAAKVNELAVNRFEAQLLHTQNLQYEIQQNIVETENRINFLTGRFPQPLKRNSATFNTITLDSIYAGVPSQLLENRPDIRQAEYELKTAKLDVKVAKANFFPSFKISAGAGLQGFNPTYLIRPESILFNFAGDLVAPLINRNAIKATYFSSNARQVQAAYNYERSILNAYIEVVNQLSNLNNFSNSYKTKSYEVDLLTRSVAISNSLFRSARADYMEVLLTQREALESKMELVEIKTKQLNAGVNLYKALGGGWN